MRLHWSEYKGVRLLMPETLWLPDEIPSCCGPGSGPLAWIIPEHLFGLCVSVACYIHDDMYDRGTFRLANRVLRINLRRLIDAGGGGAVLRRSRRAMAWVYYQAVSSDFARQYVKKR